MEINKIKICLSLPLVYSTSPDKFFQKRIMHYDCFRQRVSNTYLDKNESILMVFYKLTVGYDAAFFIMKSYFSVVFYEPINSKEVLNHRYGSVTTVKGREPVLVTSDIS